MRPIVIDPDRTEANDVVRNLAFSADGRRLGGVLGPRGSEGVRAWRYDLNRDEPLPNPDDEDYEVERIVGAADPVWSGDLELLAEVLLDGSGHPGLRVTDLWAKPTEAAWLRFTEGNVSAAYSFSADGDTLFAATRRPAPPATPLLARRAPAGGGRRGRRAGRGGRVRPEHRRHRLGRGEWERAVARLRPGGRGCPACGLDRRQPAPPPEAERRWGPARPRERRGVLPARRQAARRRQRPAQRLGGRAAVPPHGPVRRRHRGDVHARRAASSRPRRRAMSSPTTP